MKSSQLSKFFSRGQGVKISEAHRRKFEERLQEQVQNLSEIELQKKHLDEFLREME